MSLSSRIARCSYSLSSRLKPSIFPLASTQVAASKLAIPTSISLTFASGTGNKCMSTTCAGSLLTELATENPYKDVVRYEHKNRKWNLQHVDYYSDALANGLLETGLQPGDVVLTWLPPHFSESMVIQFACSKSGLVLYNLDPSVALENPKTAKTVLSRALTLTKANVLISQEAGSDVNYVRICETVIPEVRFFDFAEGKPFVTPRFPHLRFPVHTGFDQIDKWGMLRLKHFVVPSGNLKDNLNGFTVDGSTPFLGELVLDSNGVPTGIGKVQTNDEVLKGGVLETVSKVLSKEFHVVEGEGVVW